MKIGIKEIGYWSSLTAFLGASGYSITQILSPPLFPIIEFPWNEIFIVTPSIILAIAYVIAISSVNSQTDPDKKHWSSLALTFATMYAVIVSCVYITQLAVVIPESIRGNFEKVEMLSISRSPVAQAVDGIGYSFMSLAALFCAFAIPNKNTRLKKFLTFHGLMFPFTIIPLWIPPAIVISMLWFISAPGALWFLTKYFEEK